MSIYDTEFDTDRNVQTNISRLRAQAQHVLSHTFGQLIHTSSQLYTNEVPIIRSHKFQDPAHDKIQETIELIYLHAEDACDILNLYPRLPAYEARKIVLTTREFIS